MIVDSTTGLRTMKDFNSKAMIMMAATLGLAGLAVQAQESAAGGKTPTSGYETSAMPQSQAQAEQGSSYGYAQKPMMQDQSVSNPETGAPQYGGASGGDEQYKGPATYGQPTEMPRYAQPADMPMMYDYPGPRPMMRSRWPGMRHSPMRHSMSPRERWSAIEQRLENIEAMLQQLLEMQQQ
jgi:hypothetical protein